LRRPGTPFSTEGPHGTTPGSTLQMGASCFAPITQPPGGSLTAEEAFEGMHPAASFVCVLAQAK